MSFYFQTLIFYQFIKVIKEFLKFSKKFMKMIIGDKGMKILHIFYAFKKQKLVTHNIHAHNHYHSQTHSHISRADPMEKCDEIIFLTFKKLNCAK
jgi:predicted phosphoadenosine phosphosulfate sulfurtransferase